jgi:hypothetical protein
MYSISYGLDLVAQEVSLALGEQPYLEGKLKLHCAVFELFPAAEGQFKEISGFTNKSRYTYFSVKAKPGKKIGPAKNGYKAAAVIIVSSPSKQEFEQLCANVNEMKVITQ